MMKMKASHSGIILLQGCIVGGRQWTNETEDNDDNTAILIESSISMGSLHKNTFLVYMLELGLSSDKSFIEVSAVMEIEGMFAIPLPRRKRE